MGTMMELGSEDDPRASTFSLVDEDHTLGNSLRYILNHDPRVEFCGYSVPHPSENRVNIRIQTTGALFAAVGFLAALIDWLEATVQPFRFWSNFCAGDPAKDVLKDALQDLMVMCQHIRKTFDTAVDQHKAAKGLGEVSMKSGVTEPSTSRSQASQHKAK